MEDGGCGIERVRIDCVRVRGAEGGGMAALSSFARVAIPAAGLIGLDKGKLEDETSLVVLTERGVSCGSWLLSFRAPSLSTESYTISALLES